MRCLTKYMGRILIKTSNMALAKGFTVSKRQVKNEDHSCIPCNDKIKEAINIS